MTNRTLSCVLTFGCGALALTGAGTQSRQPPRESPIQREVRHQLATLTRYTVFDDIQYRVDGTNVTLIGEVTRPVVKDDAEAAVKGIEGIGTVTDQIEVLPLSPDQQIRRAVFNAVYEHEELNRYQASPTIHIIVKNGDVTLVGAVMNEMDRRYRRHPGKSGPRCFPRDKQLEDRYQPVTSY